MIGVLAVIGGLAGGWLVIAGLGALVLGRMIARADMEEGCHGAKPLPERRAAA